ncbi:MAG: hypothetical protein A2X94_14095 [Bdellovibrionales bacterium GWB1_55_8]|nr:MAG: hypothetical protein A2X94_14095 [Bdellovibrionales bacterium GWB1_55_8]
MAFQSNALRTRIPGWGADLDPRNRPAVPREKAPPQGTGAHWEEPERQVAKVKILVSSEHKGLTPVFGTSCPPKGLSGKVREFAFRFSEGRKAHWLLLLMADRIDVLESGFASVLSGKAHNPLKEMGLGSEFERGAFRGRFGQHRSDVQRWRTQILLLLGPIGLVYYVFRRAMRSGTGG